MRRFLLLSTKSTSSYSPLASLPSSPRTIFTTTSPLNGDGTEKVVSPSCFRGSPGFAYGLNSALAGRGIIVKDRVFQNLDSAELQQRGAKFSESVSGYPVHVRGNVVGGASEMSKAQFSKLLKQVTSHLSSIPDIFVHDGAIGSVSECTAKVRVISDSPSAVLSLSNILWCTSARAISHDPCPLTVYVATSVSPSAGVSFGLGTKGTSGFIAADVERSSLILYGKAFADRNAIKEVLAALSEPVISARGGLPLSARLLVSGDSVVLLFAPKDTIGSCSELYVLAEPGVVLSSHGAAPLFRASNFTGIDLFKLPAAVILASSDSSGAIPPISKLSPGQTAYHFLAGYQNGHFVPGYRKGPSSIEPLALAKDLLSKLKENKISSFLMNVNREKNHVTGKDLLELVELALSNNAPAFEAKDKVLRKKYKTFISNKFQELPDEFSF